MIHRVRQAVAKGRLHGRRGKQRERRWRQRFARRARARIKEIKA